MQRLLHSLEKATTSCLLSHLHVHVFLTVFEHYNYRDPVGIRTAICAKCLVNKCWTTRAYSCTATQKANSLSRQVQRWSQGFSSCKGSVPWIPPWIPLGEQRFYSTVNTYILFFLGVPPSSAVGISCSPGRTHSIGPSSLWLRCVRWREERAPHGRVRRRNGQSSRRSGGKVERRGKREEGGRRGGGRRGEEGEERSGRGRGRGLNCYQDYHHNRTVNTGLNDDQYTASTPKMNLTLLSKVIQMFEGFSSCLCPDVAMVTLKHNAQDTRSGF